MSLRYVPEFASSAYVVVNEKERVRKDPLPSLAFPLFVSCVHVINICVQFVVFIAGGSILNVAAMAWAALFLTWNHKFWLPGVHKRRAEVRRRNWERWLKSDPAAVASHYDLSEIDWNEYERVAARLLEQGREPTIGVVIGAMRSDAQARNRQAEMRKHGCKHRRIEEVKVYELAYGRAETITTCMDCGADLDPARGWGYARLFQRSP